MALHPRQAPSRTWYRLALAALLAALLPAYWLLLQGLEADAETGARAVADPVPLLDRHTPRVD